MKIKVIKNTDRPYELITYEEISKAMDKGNLKVNHCPFCITEHTRGGSWTGDWCPKCKAYEIIDEWHRDIKVRK